MIIIDISGNHAAIRQQQTLTCGTVGAKVQFRLDPSWTGLTKTAVFRAGNTTRDAVLTDTEAVIPHEVLLLPGQPLQIGLYGANADGTVVIPTVWASTAPIQPGADPSGDPGLEPTQPLWQQVLTQVGDMETALDEILAIQNALIGGDAR